MTAVGERPRVVPGRFDRYEIEDVVRESLVRDSEQVPWKFRDAQVSIPEVSGWVDGLVQAAVEEAAQRGYPTVRHGRSLVLLGAVGTGKTHNALGAVRELSSAGVRFQWLCEDTENLFSKLRPRHGVDHEDVFERITGVGVLVLDEIGAHKLTEWTEVQLTRVINHRYKHGLPSIYISNKTPNEFDAVVGERVSSRLAEVATELVIGGPDRRRQCGAR